jgi:hypothetical protein
MSTSQKLAPNLAFLFALATLGVVIAVTYAIPHITGPLSPKIIGGIYFALFGAGATAATVLTSAGLLRIIAAFALAGLGLGAFYYAVIASNIGGTAGATMGVVFAAAFTVDALAAGIAGAMFGAKLRKGLPQLAGKRA